MDDGSRGSSSRSAEAFGRARAVRSILSSLHRDRLLCLAGSAGVGKSAVARLVALEIGRRENHRVISLDISRIDTHGLEQSIAASLGSDNGHRAPLSEVLRFLNDTPTLVVFDNCEHVAEQMSGLCRDIAEMSSKIQVLATSRHVMRIPDRMNHRLVPLPTPPGIPNLSAASILQFPSARLLLSRMTVNCAHQPVTHEVAGDIADLCRRLEGIPLAIEMAALRIEEFGLKGLIARMDRSLSLLSRGLRTAHVRHRSLRCTLEWSYQLLDRTERLVFGKLSDLPSDFSLEAAIERAAGSGDRLASIRSALDGLVDKSLIHQMGAPTSYTYRMLDMTRAFAREKRIEQQLD